MRKQTTSRILLVLRKELGSLYSHTADSSYIQKKFSIARSMSLRACIRLKNTEARLNRKVVRPVPFCLLSARIFQANAYILLLFLNSAKSLSNHFKMADEDDLVEAFTAEDPTVMQEESHLALLKRKSSKRCCIISFIVVAICLAVTVVVVVALAVALAMGNSEEHKPTTSPSDVCLTESCVQLAAKVLSGLDQSINPCQDFYNFTCGNWIYNTIIPQGIVY